MSEQTPVYHITPHNDTFEHSIDSRIPCKCNPTIKEAIQDGIVVSILMVHNSFDGREGVELAKEILNCY